MRTYREHQDSISVTTLRGNDTAHFASAIANNLRQEQLFIGRTTMRARLLSMISAIALGATGLYGVSALSPMNVAQAASFDLNGPDDGCGASGQPACSSSFGNSRVFTSNDPTLNVTVRAWSMTGNSTGSGSGFNDKSQDAFLGFYSGNGLGVTNRDPVGSSITDRGTSSSTAGNGGDGDGSSSQHTMDNVGRLDFMSFFFNKSVRLDSVAMNAFTCCGFSGDPDTDIQVYVGNAVDGPDSGTTITDADVVAMINNKTLLDLDTLLDEAGIPDEPFTNEGASAASRTAFFSNLPFGNLIVLMPKSDEGLDSEDMIKVAGMDVTTNIPDISVPEPMSSAFFTGSLLGLAWLRRRAARKAKATTQA
jgi:hypothetical protein